MAASDETLVKGVLGGDKSAFAELYDRWARLVRAVCHDATGDVDSAADLTQEVFFRAYRYLGELREPRRFSGWLLGIARRVCREWRRSRLYERSALRRWTVESACREEAESDGRPDDRIAELRNAITSLAEKERLALHAFYLQGQDAEQARAVLGLSRSGLYRVLAVARQRLKRVLSRQETSP